MSIFLMHSISSRSRIRTASALMSLRNLTNETASNIFRFFTEVLTVM